MNPSSNPTSASAVIGEDLSLSSGASRAAELFRGLVMPAVLAGFASYLLVGIITMDVPEGASFPGPEFFPTIIVVALYLFAVIEGIRVVHGWRKPVKTYVLVQTGSSEVSSSGVHSDSAAAVVDGNLAKRTVRIDWVSMLWVMGSFLVFTVLLNVLGWIIAAAFLFVGIAKGFGSKRWLSELIVGLTLSSIIYIAFDMALSLSLPSGILGWEF